MAQQYYPESLGHGYVCYPPLLFNVLWRAAQPFLDAVTKCAAAQVSLPHGSRKGGSGVCSSSQAKQHMSQILGNIEV